ncbi:MAG: O-antigen ligase family protein [Ruminococcus flavefaciens]|nr:O-antigen ligase family protein [Ruminococcus flavefaciens]
MQKKKDIKPQTNSIYDWNAKLQTITHKTGNIIVTLYFLVLTIIFPFYTQGGYAEIGEVKYYLFRNIGLAITAVMILVMAESFFLKRKSFSIRVFYKNLSVTDFFMYGYFIFVLISYIFTPFKWEAFWGAEGWYMGLVSQLLFIGIYFLFSRYFIWSNKWLYVVLISSGLVFFLGILNRYSVYPIYMDEQTPGFISTMGNINWFCGYWAVICPIGVVFYWISSAKWQQIAAGIYVVICFITGVIQGSSSAYLVLAGVFIFLFALSFQGNRAMYRLLQLCILFALSCQIARLLRYLPGLEMNYENELSVVLTDTNLTLFFGLAFIAIYVLFHYFVKKKNCDIKQHKKIRNVVLIIMAAVLIVYVLLLVGNTCLSGGLFGLSGVSFFTFNDEWASYRGATWSIGLQAYKSMPLFNKLVGGAGPDCFAEYIYSVEDLEERAYELFGYARLTNAHNEWITVLVNYGIMGFACFVGAFAASASRFMKKAHVESALYLFAASILLYTLHNMVSFQQILNAPFVFMVLGIGEGICRKIDKSL